MTSYTTYILKLLFFISYALFSILYFFVFLYCIYLVFYLLDCLWFYNIVIFSIIVAYVFIVFVYLLFFVAVIYSFHLIVCIYQLFYFFLNLCNNLFPLCNCSICFRKRIIKGIKVRFRLFILIISIITISIRNNRNIIINIWHYVIYKKIN